MTMRALRWVAVTVLATFIGSYGTLLVNRARPRVDIVAITTTRAFHDRFGSDLSIAVDSNIPAVSYSLESHWTRLRTHNQKITVAAMQMAL